MMTTFSWDDLPLFLTIVSAGSFARAAVALNISQPQVSRRIDQLEGRLGTKLFERKSTGVQLTHAGKSILPIAERMHRSASQIQDSASSQKSSVEGSVSISIPDGLASYWVLPAVSDFQSENPKLKLIFDCGMWRKETTTLNSDFAITYEEPKDQDTVRIPLCWMHYSYFAAPSYVEKYGIPTNLGELLSHLTIHHVAQNKQRDNWSTLTKAVESLSQSQLVTNSSAASIMALRSGAGILAAPTAVCELFPELVPLPIDKAVTLKLYLYYRREAIDVARLEVVKKWLMQLFDPKQTAWFREEFIDPCEYNSSQLRSLRIGPKVA